MMAFAIAAGFDHVRKIRRSTISARAAAAIATSLRLSVGPLHQLERMKLSRLKGCWLQQQQ